jgi:membrane fusion protein, multidrug efflux system
MERREDGTMNMKLARTLNGTPAAVRDFPNSWQRATPRTRWMVLGAVALLLLAGLAWHFLSAGPAPQAEPPPPVHVATVQTKSVTALEHTIATVVAPATVQVAAQVSGQLMSAAFSEGQIVHTGEILFRIDPKPFAAALLQAQAALARDQANSINAEHDKDRFATLAAQGAASAQQRDQAVATANADAAIVKSDMAAIAIAKLNLGYTTIVSPINGKTGPILIQPGNLVTASNSASPLVTITQIQPIKVSMFLPQSDLPRLADQMRAGKLNVVVDLHNGSQLTAPIDFIGNQVDAKTGTIELRATFPNGDNRLVPGQLVDVGVAMNQFPNALVVARDAVNTGPDNHYVFVLTKDDVAVMRPVKVIDDDGTRDAIEGDVKPGDRVITEGQLRVLPGRPVAVANSPP